MKEKSDIENANPYLKYGLLKNPFPSIPIYSPWHISPFYNEVFQSELSYINELLNKLKMQNLQVSLITGERGCGKSSLLGFILKNCLETNKVTSVYMSFGHTSGFAPLYRCALWWLGEDFIRKVCVDAMARHMISKYLANFKWNPDVAFTNLLYLGDNLKFPILIELFNLLAEEKGLVIGVDGFDNIFQQLANNQKIDLLYGFSRLIEGVEGNVSFFLTARTDLLLWLNKNVPILEIVGVNNKIIEPNVLYLSKLSPRQAYNLVSNFLNEYRIFSNVYKENKLYPFTDEAFELLYKTSEGNLRKLLILCRDILGFSTSQNCPCIDKQITAKYLSLINGF